MRQLILGSVALIALAAAGPAVAADMRVKAPVYKAAPPVALYNWNGFYVGGHLGWAWVKEDSINIANAGIFGVGVGTEASRDRNGFLAGGQIGFNWQSGNWVFGIEGDYSWSDTGSTATRAAVLNPAVVGTSTVENNWFATLTGRLGFAQANWLLYVKGGIAWTDVTYGASATGPAPFAGTLGDISDTRTGWTIGAGVEWGMRDNWSAKLEYNYMDFGTERYVFTTVSPVVVSGPTLDFDQQVHAVKLGLNYRFGDFGKGPVGKGPVVTRY